MIGVRGRLASAAATAPRSISGVIGLRRKSVAPSCIASTASSIDANAVTMTTQASGFTLLQPHQRLQSVDPRHLLIEQHRGVAAAVAKPRQAFFAGRRLVHLVPRGFERQPHHLADVRFVVDDQQLHAVHLSIGPPAPPTPAGGGSSPRIGTVNVNVDPRPGSDCTVS